MTQHKGWIGVDLDGTLAKYDGWRGADHIGDPIGPMVERVKGWLADGVEVRIFTARVYSPDQSGPRWDEACAAEKAITEWCVGVFGKPLAVTCTKDYGMVQLWDDRAVRVVANSGLPCCDSPR